MDGGFYQVTTWRPAGQLTRAVVPRKKLQLPIYKKTQTKHSISHLQLSFQNWYSRISAGTKNFKSENQIIKKCHLIQLFLACNFKKKKNYPLFKPKEHNFQELYWCVAVPLFVTQHTQPLSLEQVLLTHVAHSEAAVWTQVAAVEEQSQLRVTPRTYLGEVVSCTEHALHPDCLDLGLELAVHGARKINIHIKFFCETSFYKMVHMSKRINKMQHNLFLV